MKPPLFGLLSALLSGPLLFGLSRPGTEFPIYQFPTDAIPRIDGQADDWAQVPETYVVGTEELWDSSGKFEETRP